MVHGLIEYLVNPAFLPYFSWEALEWPQPREVVRSDWGWLVVPTETEAKISMFLGTVLVGLALAGMVFLAAPIVGGEVRQILKGVRINNLPTSEQQEVTTAEQVTFTDFVAQDEVLALIKPVDRDFGLVIPKIEVNSKVSANINADNPKEYLSALKLGLAHAKGSALPGEKGDSFIFGHSTDFAWNVASWNALFYNLKELTVGDKVYVFYQGEPKIYQVTGKEVYEVGDMSWLHAQGETERLVLATCWPPGTTLKRLVVLAEPLGLEVK